MFSPETKPKPHHHHHHSPASCSGSTNASGPRKEREKDENQPFTHPLLPETSSSLTVPSPRPPRSPKPKSRKLALESFSHAMSVYGSPESQYPWATTSGRSPKGWPDQLAFSRRIETEARTCRLSDIEGLSRAEKASETATEIVEIHSKMLTERENGFERERLCIKVGEALGEDRTLVTIWEMGDIELNDEAMIVRVKDLVSSLPSPNESRCTD